MMLHAIGVSHAVRRGSVLGRRISNGRTHPGRGNDREHERASDEGLVSRHRDLALWGSRRSTFLLET